MKLIDVHCHINDTDYGDVDKLIKAIKASGVEKIISVGFDIESSEYCKRLSEEYDCVYFTAGFHPTELKKYSFGDLEKISRLAQDKKCVAIGEIGLDYHYPDTDKPMQKQIFIEQLELAERLSMPVQIHSRDCAEDMLEIIEGYTDKLKILFHCYSHSPEIAAELEKRGVYFSFGGMSTYSGSKKAQRTIRALSFERILTETDSPYLPPVSKKGVFPNTPESIREIGENIAFLKAIKSEELFDRVWTTAHELFPKLNN